MSDNRRKLLKVLTGAVGGSAALAVGTPVLRALMTPVGRVTVTGTGEFVQVCTLEAVPEDGAPVQASVVIQSPIDGWNRMPPSEVGSVWLMKKDKKIVAFSTICPHLGCGIDYEGSAERFVCRCHDSYFSIDGSTQSGPSPRGMDSLETRIVDGMVEIKFEKFAMGVPEKRSV